MKSEYNNNKLFHFLVPQMRTKKKNVFLAIFKTAKEKMAVVGVVTALSHAIRRRRKKKYANNYDMTQFCFHSLLFIITGKIIFTDPIFFFLNKSVPTVAKCMFISFKFSFSSMGCVCLVYTVQYKKNFFIAIQPSKMVNVNARELKVTAATPHHLYITAYTFFFWCHKF